MRLSVLAVGRLKAGPERELFERYAKRLTASAGALGAGVEWREFDESRGRSAEERKGEEARTLLGAVPKGAWLAVLDERGKALTSPQWAEEIGRVKDGAAPAYAVLIGGPDGLDESLRRAARSVISFGALTWPHQLVRVMAAEQLYRAMTILSAHPYHRS